MTTLNSPNRTTKARQALVAIVEQVLAEESHLAARTRGYVWRVRGSPWQSVKRLVAEQGRQVDNWFRELAKGAQVLGIPVRVSDVAPVGEPAEHVAESATSDVNELMAMHEALARDVRTAVQLVTERDPRGETVRLLKGLLDFHETTAWMLRVVLSTERSRLR